MSKRDMRRSDLVVPYVEPPKDESMSGQDMASSMGTMFPMAAIFTKNKYIGWVGVMLSLLNWLAETPEQKKTTSTPGYFSVGMAFMALLSGYMPLFLPPVPGQPAPAAAAS